MLQPTSCGPGPPPLPPATRISITTRRTQKPIQQKHATNCNKNVVAFVDVDDDGDDDCSKKLLNRQQQQQQQQQQENQHDVVAAVVNEEKVKCLQQQQQQQHIVNNMHNSSSSSSSNSKSKDYFSKFLAPTTTTAAATKWTLMLLMFFTLLSAAPMKVTAEKSKHYYMQSLCKNHFLQQLYRKIDGAVLWSQNERNLDCIITFQTHSILQRFMLRFDMLQLDCNDHLYVYDGAHAVSTPKVDISCRNTKQTVSSILTRTNFVTLKYVTDNWGTDANGFKLVITSVKDPKHTCKDFTCGTREFCIHPDLLCDGINHCGDNSDESFHNLCQSPASGTIMGLELTWFVLIIVSSLLIMSACFVGWAICFCRRSTSGNMNPTTAMQLHHAAETNGSSKHLHHQYHGTLTREHTTLPPSGNWHHPAGPSGYHRIMQHNLLKMATKVRPIWCSANSVN